MQREEAGPLGCENPRATPRTLGAPFRTKLRIRIETDKGDLKHQHMGPEVGGGARERLG